MQEYLSEAVVLNVELNGDLNSRIALLTKRYGKLTAKAKSARKITSKLAGHLQPGNVVRVRLVEKSGLQVVDALKERQLAADPAKLYLLEGLLAEGQSEEALWPVLVNRPFSWRAILPLLGWDPSGASCEICGRSSPTRFRPGGQSFLCETCASKLRPNEVFSID
jgi:recombinational DNA repair protein (RecF pathway)